MERISTPRAGVVLFARVQRVKARNFQNAASYFVVQILFIIVGGPFSGYPKQTGNKIREHIV